jgi:hypothetical protein
VFPVRHELNSYILFTRNSVFKWLRKKSLFIVTTVGSTQIHYVSGMQSFSMRTREVHIEPLGFKS